MVARWHVSAAEWDRFRTFDSTRAAELQALRNDTAPASRRRQTGWMQWLGVESTD